MAPKGYIEIYGIVVHETELAVLIDCGLKDPLWFPKSHLEDWPDVGESGEILMTEWIAKEKEVI